MTREEIAEKVRRAVSKCLGYKANDSTSLKDPLTDDLLKMFVLSEEIEKEFDITLSDTEGDALASKTVREVIEFVGKKRKAI
ncbi:MAG: acyl carrier protein [bacterium]|nr:acyl carrier protein [bacterium]